MSFLVSFLCVSFLYVSILYLCILFFSVVKMLPYIHKDSCNISRILGTDRFKTGIVATNGKFPEAPLFPTFLPLSKHIILGYPSRRGTGLIHTTRIQHKRVVQILHTDLTQAISDLETLLHEQSGVPSLGTNLLPS